MRSFALVLPSILAITAYALPVHKSSSGANPLSNTNYGPIPGESETYIDYLGKAAPFPANMTAPIPATSKGPAGPDDLLFQNLLAAEWVIYSFYQSGVENFTTSSFTDLGLPNTTYERITQIRDNEAGHLRIFQDSISSTSLKPGACTYSFPYSNAEDFLALQVLLEIASQAFLTGLIQEGSLNATKAALVGIAEVETRHNTWALIDVWNTNPFVGPSDTVFPYANQILDVTNAFVVPGSCPAQNPAYPSPSQHLPQLAFDGNTTTATPGANITFEFSDSVSGATPVSFEPCADKDYYAVFFHALVNITMPFDKSTNSSQVPAQFDGQGIIIVVIADEPGAPSLESVVAGPLFLLEQPSALTLELDTTA